MRHKLPSIRRPALNQNGLRVYSSFSDHSSLDFYDDHQQRGFPLCCDVDVSMSQINPNNPRWIAHIATQYFNLTDINGDNVPTSLTDIEDFFHHKSNSLIIFGVQVGLCIMLTMVLALLTKAEKRRTAIFALNITGLILETIRFITISIQYNSVLFAIAVQVLGATALETSDDFVAPVIYSVSTIIWYAVVETSLVLQVRVVFGAERKLQKLLTVGLGFLFGVTAAFKIAVQAWNTKAILTRVLGITDPVFVGINRTAQVLFVLTVGLSSAIFVAKLIYLIRRRQKMGFQAFGPLQVILIMATQCLIVPCTFPLFPAVPLPQCPLSSPCANLFCDSFLRC
jgi:pheromone alpha factor receptor